jgi:hypothetical protein
MIHSGDTIEEVATRRQGRVSKGGSLVNGEEVLSRWQVHFSDGKDPVIKLFLNEADIRLIARPHQTSGPGFYPAESIMGPY